MHSLFISPTVIDSQALRVRISIIRSCMYIAPFPKFAACGGSWAFPFREELNGFCTLLQGIRSYVVLVVTLV